MGGTRILPKLSEGYTLDLANDPDAPALRSPDGVVVARFSTCGVRQEAIEHEAWEDLLRDRCLARVRVGEDILLLATPPRALNFGE